ncbi:XRE family transcriptional regulator [Novosphingobium aquae]|uniref:S24 family peptidase n=1 Tax=Novosphingobium aquae TaxID=3133435 RepID=A0ABU8S3Y5_9SPHN
MAVDYNQSFRAVNRKKFRADYYHGCKVAPMFRGDRLEALLLLRGISQSELARRVGISQASIWKLTKEPAQGSKHIHKIARELGTSPEYLMGESDIEDGPTPGESRLAFRGAEPEPPPNPDLVEIDEIDLRFGMGGTYLDEHVNAEPRQFSRAWLKNFTKAAPEHLVWTIGDGDSMEPTIRSGEVILIDKSQTKPLMGDGIWAAAFGEIGIVKRLLPMPDGTVQIHSDNPLVRPQVATDGELHIIGRVIAVVRRL